MGTQENRLNETKILSLKYLLVMQGWYSLEKYLNMKGFLEKFLKIKSALESAVGLGILLFS